MAAGWSHWKEHWNRQPPKHVVQAERTNGVVNRDFSLRWIQGKREDNKERQLIQWLGRVTGEKVPTGNVDFGETLKDGILLCKLINKLQPGSVKRIHLTGVYAFRENVGNFISACKKYGMRDEDCFTAVDLCDRHDLSLVASTLLSLAELARSRDRNFPLP